jgi:hypothetical protein
MAKLLIALGMVMLTLVGCASDGSGRKWGQTTEWKTYRNTEYGYTIQYPGDWGVIQAAPRTTSEATQAQYVLLEQELQKVTFVERAYSLWQGEFQIRVIANPARLNLEQWVDGLKIEDVSGGDLIQERSPATISGKPAIRLSIFGFDHEEIAVISTRDNESIYFFSFAGRNPNDPNVTTHQALYAAMLSSFTYGD